MKLQKVLEALSLYRQTIYPVGAIFTTTDKEYNPNDDGCLYGYWVPVAKGRVLIGVGQVEANTTDTHGSVSAGYYNISESEKLGGSADQIVVEHTHTQAAHTHTGPSHTHVMDEHTHTQVAHSHGTGDSSHSKFAITDKTVGQEYIGNVSGTVGCVPQVSGSGSNLWTQTTATDSQTPAINSTLATMQAAGGGDTGSATPVIEAAGTSDGTYMNLPPYYSVYFWLRTT